MAKQNWNDDWKEALRADDENCMDRLGECRNTKRDLQKIAKYMYKFNSDKTKEEVLDRTIEWITDWNNQVGLCPDDDEYARIIKSM